MSAMVWSRTIEAINIVIWLAIGCATGWVATRVRAATSRTAFIESMFVGVFGAFIGGEFIATQLRGAGEPGITIVSLVLAVLGAAVMLMLLGVMRRAVGPLRSGKAKRAR